MHFSESIIEDAALAWVDELGYAVLHGPGIVVGMLGAERSDPNCRDVVPNALIPGELRVVNADQFLREAV